MTKPLSAASYRARAKRIAHLAAQVERLADATAARDKASRTRAINVMSRLARELYVENTGDKR